MGGPGRHHLDPVAVAELAVDDADVGDHAAVGVVDRVEDQRPGGGVGVTDRGRGALDHLVEHLGDTLAGLGAHPQHVFRLAADDVRELVGVLLGVGARQVDLVEHRDDLEVGREREVEVGQGLGLDALGGVDQQDRGLTGLQRPGDLVGEVHVTRGVDHVEHVGAGLGALLVARLDRPRHPDGLALDGDAALALDVHPVEVLRTRAALVDHAGQLQHPVRERRLAVVDVGDDAEVADRRRVGVTGRRHGLGGQRLALGTLVLISGLPILPRLRSWSDSSWTRPRAPAGPPAAARESGNSWWPGSQPSRPGRGRAARRSRRR